MSTLEKPTPIDSHADPLLSLLRRQKDAFRKEGEVTYETRIDRLRRLKAFILENKTAFARTTKAEFGAPAPTSSACSRSSRRRWRLSTTASKTLSNG